MGIVSIITIIGSCMIIRDSMIITSMSLITITITRTSRLISINWTRSSTLKRSRSTQT